MIKANRSEPEINRSPDDFANHYGITVIPTRFRSQKGKSLVENRVKLVYNCVYDRFRNRQFSDLDSLNLFDLGKVKTHNQTRMQQKPDCREERFLVAEKSLIKPLPADGLEVKYYLEPKVAHIIISTLGKTNTIVAFPCILRS